MQDIAAATGRRGSGGRVGGEPLLGRRFLCLEFRNGELERLGTVAGSRGSQRDQPVARLAKRFSLGRRTVATIRGRILPLRESVSNC
uniref:Uncharacterized protein n=1 Tax=uncultured marine virus TaxID=186617 RepID=A0A0F7LAK7_9VIRU|nr:hypothetical protein [uncultured marine virus]